MKEGKSKRKEWVKNVAIIFLSVMLVLTFFSNTFMNYSLPEVATVYVQPGSITAKVRGTGNVEASDPYNVVASETRVITSVAVKQGDEVEKGDVLYHLEEAESTELAAAEAELNALVLEYTLSLLSGDLDAGMISRVESGNTDSLTAAQSRIAGIQNTVDVAEANVTTLQENVNNLNRQLELLTNNSTADTTAEQAAVTNAEKNVTNANNAVTNADTKVNNLNTKKTEHETNLANIVKEAQALGFDVTQENYLAVLENNIATAKELVVSAQNGLEIVINGILSEYNYTGAKLTGEAALEEARTYGELNKLLGSGGVTADMITASMVSYDQVMAKYNTAATGVSTAEAAMVRGQQLRSDYQSYQSRLTTTDEDISEAKDERADIKKNADKAADTLTTAKQVLADKEANRSNANSQKDVRNQLIDAEAALAAAQTQLKTAQDDQAELIKTLQAEMNLDSKNDQIEAKEQEIEKLKEKSMGSTITAPVAGKITSVAHVAGESVKLDEEVAVIQVAGKGFTVSFSVTNEQATKVKVGDMAELQNAWYYSEMQLMLSAIRPDPDNPGQRKLLTFTVSGNDEIQAGQALNISVGQRSADYELTVPNSAIREDSNGKFILIVEVRSSPLGNRYYATRVDVEVLAEDDTNSAISAGLYGHEYVITTATKPVVAGKLVRLSEN